MTPYIRTEGSTGIELTLHQARSTVKGWNFAAQPFTTIPTCGKNTLAMIAGEGMKGGEGFVTSRRSGARVWARRQKPFITLHPFTDPL